MVDQSFEEVPVQKGDRGPLDQRQGKGKAGGRFNPLVPQRNGNHRHLREAGILQGLTDQWHVVSGPAAPTGLAHHHGGMVQVVLTTLQCFDHLPN